MMVGNFTLRPFLVIFQPIAMETPDYRSLSADLTRQLLIKSRSIYNWLGEMTKMGVNRQFTYSVPCMPSVCMDTKLVPSPHKSRRSISEITPDSNLPASEADLARLRKRRFISFHDDSTLQHIDILLRQKVSRHPRDVCLAAEWREN